MFFTARLCPGSDPSSQPVELADRKVGEKDRKPEGHDRLDNSDSNQPRLILRSSSVTSG
jgi:hypothetical protein